MVNYELDTRKDRHLEEKGPSKFELESENENQMKNPFDKCPKCGSSEILFDHKYSLIVCENEKCKAETPACPDCKNVDDIVSGGKLAGLICGICGLELSKHEIDQGRGARAFDQAEQYKRIGDHPSDPAGTGPQMDWRDKDIYGKSFSPKRKAEIYRMRRLQNRLSYSQRKRTVLRGIYEIDRITSQLGLYKNIKDAAYYWFKKAVSKRILRGRSIPGAAAASTYLACRLNKQKVSIQEIKEKSHKRSRKEISNMYSTLVKAFEPKVPFLKGQDYVPQIASGLKLSPEVEKYAIIEILDKAYDTGITQGKDPKALAGAAIYISACVKGERRTQREISKIARVTEVTVRNRYKELVRELNLPMDNLK